MQHRLKQSPNLLLQLSERSRPYRFREFHHCRKWSLVPWSPSTCFRSPPEPSATLSRLESIPGRSGRSSEQRDRHARPRNLLPQETKPRIHASRLQSIYSRRYPPRGTVLSAFPRVSLGQSSSASGSRAMQATIELPDDLADRIRRASGDVALNVRDFEGTAAVTLNPWQAV
jgi:hypothetical protein